jgi:hypothetical protein
MTPRHAFEAEVCTGHGLAHTDPNYQMLASSLFNDK